MELGALLTLAVVAGFVQSTFGFGFALVFAPLAAVLVGPRVAVAVTLTLNPLLSFGLYWEHRPRERLRDLVPLLVPAVAGFPVGLALLTHVNEQALRVLVGGAVVAGAAANLATPAGATTARQGRAALSVPLGALAGVLGGATGLSGPPIVLYEHWVGGGALRIRRRLFAFFAWFSLIGVLLALVGGVLTWHVGALVLVAIPAAVAGAWAGRALRPRLAEEMFRRLSLALLAVTAFVAALVAALALA